MKKVFAIIAAVILAFVIALGDQIIKMSLSDNPLGIHTLKGYFGFDDGGIEISDKPIIPGADIEPEVVNLTYDERIKKGDYYYDRGFLVFASSEFIKASALEPTRTEPFLKLTQIYFDLGDFTKSKNNADLVLQLKPSNYEAQHFLILINIKLNNFVDAEALIDKLLASGISDYRFYYYKALLKIASNHHDEGQALLKQALAGSAGLDSELQEKIQKILAGYAEFEFAEAAEELYLSELLARAFNQIGEYELAIYKTKEILRERPDLRDSWILLGFSYLNLNKYIFALTSFEHAYEIDSELPTTQYFLGITHSELSRYDNAIIYFNYALENGFKPSIVIRQKLADLYLEVGDYQKSVEAYSEVLDYSGQDINAYVRPIWIYLDFLQQPEKALKLGELAVATFPDDAMAYNLLGWSLVGLKDYTEAETNLKKSIEMDPTLPAPHYNIAKLYEETDDVDLARGFYQKAYELDQNGSIGNLAAKRYNALLLE